SESSTLSLHDALPILLCRKLMELNLSAVIDLQELALRERQEFVKIFCETLVDLPRSLWHRCFIAIDEIHEVAPEDEKSTSESARSEEHTSELQSRGHL